MVPPSATTLSRAWPTSFPATPCPENSGCTTVWVNTHRSPSRSYSATPACSPSTWMVNRECASSCSMVLTMMFSLQPWCSAVVGLHLAAVHVGVEFLVEFVIEVLFHDRFAGDLFLRLDRVLEGLVEVLLSRPVGRPVALGHRLVRLLDRVVGTHEGPRKTVGGVTGFFFTFRFPLLGSLPGIRCGHPGVPTEHLVEGLIKGGRESDRVTEGDEHAPQQRILGTR